MKKITYALCISIGLLVGCAEKKRDVPKELFGVKLGSTYSFGEGTTNSFGTLPIKKMGGVEKSMMIGQHFYFQPLEESKTFEYKEKKKTPTDEYYTTSFNLYLLPIIPSSVKTIDDLNKAKLDQVEVALIEWSDLKADKDSAYFWVLEMCKTFSADMSVKAEISDSYESKSYHCNFYQDNRRLEINNIGELVAFKLAFDKSTFDKKIEAIDSTIRKMQAKEILK